MIQKPIAVWVGLGAYLLAQAALPVLKLARVAPVAHYSWWKATCLLWGPGLLLVVVVFLGLVFKAGTGRAAHE
jgi:hypothetical protein